MSWDSADTTVDEWLAAAGGSVGSDIHITALSPPPTPRLLGALPRLSRRSSKRLSLRLRSNSGLALHTNAAILKQYTDYNSDGSMRQQPPTPLDAASPQHLRSPAISVDGTSPAPSSSSHHRASTFLGEHQSSTCSSPHARPPILDLFHGDVVQMALHDPTTAQRLAKFAAARIPARAGNMEFLIKVDEFARAVRNLASLTTHMAATFTSSTAPQAPALDLAPDLTLALHKDVKHFGRATIPSLDRLFRDAKAVVEDRVAKDVYPLFVKHQFGQCMKSCLGLGLQSAYPGLGTSFCLLDARHSSPADHPVLGCSDGFLGLSGYPRHEVFGQDLRLLQGNATDRDAVRRLRDAVANREEAIELLLNHRRDGSAFWNLVCVWPLFDFGDSQRGGSFAGPRYWLAGQVNVSETAGPHYDYKDVLGILNSGPDPVRFDDASLSQPGGRSVSEGPRTSHQNQQRAAPAAPTRDDPRRRSERSGFFQSFTRRSFVPHNDASPPAPNKPTKASRVLSSSTGSTAPSLAIPPSSPWNPHSTSMTHPYSHFLLLRFLPATTSPRPGSRKPTLGFHHPHMPIAYLSPAAAALLRLSLPSVPGNDAQSLVQSRDVFSVLRSGTNNSKHNKDNERALFPKALRAMVCERLIKGDGISFDMWVSSSGSSGHGTVGPSWLSSPSGGGANEKNQRGRSDDGDEAEGVVLVGERVGPAWGDLHKVVSHWTPLKDEEGCVEWIVVVLAPTGE